MSAADTESGRTATGYAVCDSAEPWAAGTVQPQASVRPGFSIHPTLEDALAELVRKGQELGTATPMRVRILASEDGKRFRLLDGADAGFEGLVLTALAELIDERLVGGSRGKRNSPSRNLPFSAQ